VFPKAERRPFLLTPGVIRRQIRHGGIVVAINVSVLHVLLGKLLLASLVLQKRESVPSLDFGGRSARGRAARPALIFRNAAKLLLDLPASLGQLNCKLFALLLSLSASIPAVVIEQFVFPRGDIGVRALSRESSGFR
jgi:hypothetical protein